MPLRKSSEKLKATSTGLKALFASLAAMLPLAGCQSPLTDGTSDQRIQSLPYIRYSKQDTCETQKQIEEYHSALDTMRKGRTISYTPACAKPVAPAQPSSVKPVS
jgi:hypothetical protein